MTSTEEDVAALFSDGREMREKIAIGKALENSTVEIALGAKCKLCSVQFEAEHGYPVVCHACADGRLDEDLLDSVGAMTAIRREVGE